MSFLPSYVSFKFYPKTPQRLLFTAAAPDTLELLESMLIYDPNRRISAREVDARNENTMNDGLMAVLSMHRLLTPLTFKY